MRCRCGVTGEAFHAAEADRVLRDRQSPQKIERAGFSPCNIQRKHSAWKSALTVANADLFPFVKQEGIADLLNPGMPRKRLDNMLSVLALPIHSERHRRKAAVEQPAFVGLQNVSKNPACPSQLLDEI